MVKLNLTSFGKRRHYFKWRHYLKAKITINILLVSYTKEFKVVVRNATTRIAQHKQPKVTFLALAKQPRK